MARDDDQPRHRRTAGTTPGRLAIGLAFLVAGCLLSARHVSEGSAADPSVRSVWKTGQPVPIAVDQGRAGFTLPTPGRNSRSLVIVSSLAVGPTPQPIALSARPGDPARVEDVALAADGPRRPPQLAGSTPEPVAPPVASLPPRERTFHLMVRDGDVVSASNYQAVAGRLRAVGRRVQVYVDARDVDAGRVGPEVLRDLVATFDDRVFPVAARTFGQARDVDHDGRFTVLMSSWLSRLGGGKHAVDGFVRVADLDTKLAAPYSNHCDMMYLNASLEAGDHLRTVVAHEYTHAVTFSLKGFRGPADAPTGVEEEGWLDEALAHLVEDLHGFSRSNLDYRVSAFLSQPERYRLVVDDYYTADLFRSHGNRGSTYLFLRWCADRYGAGLAPALIRSDRLGVANLEAVTGRSFADLFREWSTALFFSGFEPNRPYEPGFRSCEIRGPFNDWDLAGPRTTSVRPGDAPTPWLSAGTACRFLVVESSPTGAVEVEVEAPADAGLQVTAVPLPDDLGRIDLSVAATPGKDSDSSFAIRLREAGGTAVRLMALAWEPLTPGPDPHVQAFRRARLDALGIAAAFGRSSLPAGGEAASTRPISVGTSLSASTGPLVVKVVGADAHGRRVAGWAEVPAPEERQAGLTPSRPSVVGSN